MVTLGLHEITVDCVDPSRVGTFWAGLLGGHLHEPMPGWRRLDASAEGCPLLNF
jgi:hypothetical protein